MSSSGVAGQHSPKLAPPETAQPSQRADIADSRSHQLSMPHQAHSIQHRRRTILANISPASPVQHPGADTPSDGLAISLAHMPAQAADSTTSAEAGLSCAQSCALAPVVFSMLRRVGCGLVRSDQPLL